MITQQQIDDTVTWPGLKEFGAFVLAHNNGIDLPDYASMNLMQIPRLVPHIWVWDLRENTIDGEYLINFSGEEINRSWEYNLMGKREHLIQRERHKDAYVTIKMAAFTNALNSKRACVSLVNEEFYYNDELRTGSVETMFFPCSTDGAFVNWAIGCVSYNHNTVEDEKLFCHFWS